MPYKKSLKSKILMRKEWAVKYLDWRSKNLVAISDYEAHVTGLKSKQKKHAIMRQLKHAEDKVKMNTDRVDNCNATLEADIIKYNGEQDWLAAMPKHLLSDKPHILGLMQDPVAMLKNWMRAKTGAEESLNRLRVELSLLGVRQ